MFKKTQTTQQTLLEKEIAEIYRQMDTVPADSPEYAAMVKQLTELYKIKDPSVRDRTTLKDWIPVIASLSGIVTIIEIITGHSGLSCQRSRKLRKLSELSVSPLLCLVLATLSSHSLLMTPWGGNSPMGRQLAHGAV